LPVLIGKPTQTHLTPVQEMTPANVAQIRNSVISQLVAMVSHDLGRPESELIVRDIQPYTDLGWDYAVGTATTTTTEQWEYDVTGTSVGYNSVTGATTMADQRYVAIFGIRDGRLSLGATASGATAPSSQVKPYPIAGLVKFEVGGAISAIWNIQCMMAYRYDQAAFSPSAIVIPQNVGFNIYYYMKNMLMTKATSVIGTLFLQLIGVVVEPRGKMVSP